jgi:hypothetical protein
MEGGVGEASGCPRLYCEACMSEITPCMHFSHHERLAFVKIDYKPKSSSLFVKGSLLNVDPFMTVRLVLEEVAMTARSSA